MTINLNRHICPGCGTENPAMWKPIETYDALPEKKKPRFAAFYFEAELICRTPMRSTVQIERHYGHRTCTLWMPLPDPAKNP